ncbi:ATP-dependent DNA helicase RecG [Alloalcanivorax profundimaris]|uniref:ATP-dependent DNA helicase RecG n=1 Tax=Alloalcanivorax profundimaris TaxID=2735259 RepID=UPI0018894121|nr:ATP-dependent DNA helicase RecG [Alloalcanivorax profundimaris]MBF1803364.1 ATP-dependent DNA helicase RecG [Alloalcanivorax profundimaris]MCQ6262548.1 ATP-dependent DNA helicase RecG [Alcanivorax sp. MM125-6]
MSEPAAAPDRVAITRFKGVGPRAAERLAKLGLHTLEDVLFHLPFRYEDRTRITPIGALRPEQGVVIEGEVLAADVVFGKRRSLLCKVADGTGMVVLRFYHFSAAQKNYLEKGRAIRVYGEPRPGAAGLEFYHPEYQTGPDLPPLEKALTPVYPTTDGVSQKLLRNLAGQALQWLRGHEPEELIPRELLDQSGLPRLAEALTKLHHPQPDDPVDLLLDGNHPAVKRLVMEEMVAHQLGMLAKRAGQKALSAPRLEGERLTARLLESLPFRLTGAQQRVIGEIRADLCRDHPMLRLIQGDVGSGKTLVAAAAALVAMESGYQVALMAPTELLAEQHLNNFRHWLAPLGIDVHWLAGSVGAKARRETLAALAGGSAALVVGTHALFQDAVAFQRLGLIIIDEQHRFGVQQRLALREKGRFDNQVPHQLTLTATPIPRTLAMSVYGDLDTSVIDEMPPGRKPIQTLALPAGRRDAVVERIRAACRDGTQAYWVCTLIEESDELQARAAEATFEDLREALPDLTVELVHGRMKAKEKQARMARFASGEAQLLVATTVIEVGVDVPNATLMVMENAERLGLAQLHQLRGRVGRGGDQSYCLLLYDTPLSQTAKKRLAVMRDTSDGFVIAEEDLKLRGPGEWLGTRQTGDLAFRIADLVRDEALMAPARDVAAALLARYPQRVDRLLRRWLRGGEHFADV